jgi:SAM-dependent methyltransferase
VAEWYDALVGDEGSEYHRFVVLPGVMRLLGLSAPGKEPPSTTGGRVLDVACGQGVLCRQLQRKGFEVVGVDAAEPLLEAARKRDASEDEASAAPDAPVAPPITYLKGDARELMTIKGLKPCTFEMATLVLAAQDMDVIEPVMAGAAWALRPGGKFVMVLMHPCFRAPQQSEWGWDEKTQTQYRRVDRYLSPDKRMIVSHPGKKDGKHTWTYHRPLSAYLNALGAAGLRVEAMEEWPSHKTSSAGMRAEAENTARKEIPLFLALRAVRG